MAHAVAERGIYKLVALHPAFAFEQNAYNYRFEMLAVAHYLQMLADEA
jgi:hypothetical protein